MADAPDSGSGEQYAREGSTPFFRTITLFDRKCSMAIVRWQLFDGNCSMSSASESEHEKAHRDQLVTVHDYKQLPDKLLATKSTVITDVYIQWHTFCIALWHLVVFHVRLQHRLGKTLEEKHK